MSAVYVVFCPVCCSTVDVEVAEVDAGQPVTLDCTSCDQEFTLVIDQARMDQHAAA